MKRVIMLAGVSAVFLGLLACFGWALCVPRNPVYGGRRLSDWIATNAAPLPTFFAYSGPAPPRYRDYSKYPGLDAQAVPYLVQELSRHERVWDKWLVKHRPQFPASLQARIPAPLDPARIREAAAILLARTGPGSPATIDALVRVAGQDTNARVRLAATETLGQIGKGNTRAIEFLAGILWNDRDANLRQMAMNSLGLIGSGNEAAIQSVAVAFQRSINAHDGYQRQIALATLAQIGFRNPAAIKAVMESYPPAPDLAGRAAAMPPLTEADPGYNSHVADLFSERDARTPVIDVLGQIAVGDTNVINRLIEIGETDPDVFVRQAAIRAMQLTGNGSAPVIACLVKIAREDKRGQSAAREAIAALGAIAEKNPLAVRGLYEVTANEGGFPQIFAQRALDQLRARNAIPVTLLTDVTQNDPDAKVRAAATIALVNTSNALAIAPLIQVLLHETNLDARVEALNGLGKLGTNNAAAIEALAGIARGAASQRGYFFQVALRTLVQIGGEAPPAVKTYLEVALGDNPDIQTRYDAIAALGKYGGKDPGSLPALVKIADGDDYTVVAHLVAMGALQQLGVATPAVMDALTRRESDSNTRVAAQAQHTLEYLKSKSTPETK